jgi:ubiquinone biosynthesis protein COQ9
MTETDVTAQKDALLAAILPDVLFDGWTRPALERAAAQIGMAPSRLPGILPGGVVDLARWLDDWADRQMIAALEQEPDWATLRTHQRLILGIRRRLEILVPHREAVRRAIVLNTPPFGLTRAPRAIYHTVDALWYCAGDTATDFNFYTKRGLLAAVYGATVLYWLDDRSDGMADTWDFLERRIADVLKIPKLTGTLKRQARQFLAPLRIFKTGA